MAKDLAVVKNDEFTLPALRDMGEIFQEELEGLDLSNIFDRVKIPTGGGLAFEVPGETDDEPETVKEIVGLIIDHHPVNAYWAEKFAGGNNPPDCSSLDGKVGSTGQVCATCPMNQWGSAQDGKSKACKNMHRIYILREGEMFPLLLTLPPTSLKNFANYLAKRVVAKGKRSHEVITKISLKKATNFAGINYSQAVFSVAGVLSFEDAKKAAKLVEGIKPLTRKLEVATDEYINGEVVDDESIL